MNNSARSKQRMRCASVILLLAAICAAGLVQRRMWAEQQPDGQAQSPSQPDQPAPTDEEPLLLLDEEPLLLLDDEPAPAAAVDEADNSRCHVCHLNYATEEIAVTHARKKIGCADCHGQCDDHIDDESWASGGPGTPPETMYPRETIDTACGKCHDKHDAPANVVLARWKERCPERTTPSSIVCTDCHGHHRLKTKLRKAWWDKKTGKAVTPSTWSKSEARNTKP